VSFVEQVRGMLLPARDQVLREDKSSYFVRQGRPDWSPVAMITWNGTGSMLLARTLPTKGTTINLANYGTPNKTAIEILGQYIGFSEQERAASTIRQPFVAVQ
jgi:hypothetical protein